LTFQT